MTELSKIKEEIRLAKKAAREKTGRQHAAAYGVRKRYVFVANGWNTAYMGGVDYDDPQGHEFAAGPITTSDLKRAVRDPDADGRVVYIEGRFDSHESFYAYVNDCEDYEIGEYWSVDIGIGNPEGRLGVDPDLLDSTGTLLPEHWKHQSAGDLELIAARSNNWAIYSA